MWKDSDISGGKARLKVNFTAGATAPALVPGEVALNDADGVIYTQNNAFPSGDGVKKIVALTQAAYDALDPVVATTLYIITD